MALVEVRGVSKSFGSVKVLSNVDFECEGGEIHGLVGANGAGKSTLIKILSGIHKPDSGNVLIDGKQMSVFSPAHATELGIGVIHQEFDLIPQMSVAQNLFLGREPRLSFGKIDFNSLYLQSQKYLEQVCLGVSPWDIVQELSVEQKQLLAIAKVLSQNARLIIMDEPTAALNGAEVQNLLRIMRELAQKGTAIIFISHHLEEVFDVTHRVTVLRDGQVAGSGTEMDENTVVKLMTGREILAGQRKEISSSENAKKAKKILLQVNKLTRNGDFYDISFSLGEGEILGFIGLEGQGQRQILRAFYGDCCPDSGDVIFRDEKLNVCNPSDPIRRGVVFVPEERKEEGLCLSLNVAENIALSTLGERSTFGVIKSKDERAEVAGQMKSVNLSPPDPSKIVVNLSGGNQQKVVIAKCLACKPSLLLFSEPTRGIDIGAKSEIYSIIRDMADSGSGVIIVSGELSELLQTCDRIMIVNKGRIVDEILHGEEDKERIMRSMWGLRGESVA